ncbi:MULTISPECIES: TIGR02281 family clan AA aspartic protease [unclassified Wenzhouxiangella]|uniref:retropepsin-like aspartic protease family protein n=1 Tax=unclassified Wenzhouxiangella TaxID=2613841 RepID=UPI001C6EB79D|nr:MULTISPECIES: TIGR02281 family clan AA aspartic protease [unclassified Wenzhouxiangella]
MNPQRTGFGMMVAAAVGVLLLLTFVFSGLVEDRRNPNKQVQSQRVNGGIEVVLESDRQGHFIATGAINGREVTFLVDTGATLVSVPEGRADELGLERMAPIGLETATGPVTGWMTRIDEVRLGDIVQRDVRAAISPGRSDTILLGMSFLRDLDITQSNGQLRLVAAQGT